MPDLALELLRHGYRALPRLWDHAGNAGADHAETRLLGHRAVVVRGAQGAQLFYDETLVRRADAVPPPLGHLLFGKGAVHALDGAEHRDRKALFLQVMNRERVELLGEAVERELAGSAYGWPTRVPFSLFDELVRVYGEAVVPWAGIDVQPGEAAAAARRLAWIVDGFGFSPGAYARGWGARWWADRWAARLVREARDGSRRAPDGTMLGALATGAGRRLPVHVAAVELVNVVRPTVAVAWLGAFAAVALARHPAYGATLADRTARRERWHFADEVRRTAPFVPALAGRIRRPATWHGVRLGEGDLLVLDVPGTDHHGGTWPDADDFRPERFAERAPDVFEHVPQGGGDPRHGHRCPGEPIAMSLLDRTLLQLARTRFTVTSAEADLGRIPTLPGGGPLLTDARPADDGPFLLARR
jgi:fatty-acid peroxygenase